MASDAFFIFVRRLGKEIETIMLLTEGEKMEKQQKNSWIKNGAKILSVLAFLFLFIYSFQSVVAWEWHPNRQGALFRILAELFNPSFSDSEFVYRVSVEIWETVQVAYLATAMSALLAILLTVLSARPSSFLGYGFNVLLQPLLSVTRAVHPLFIIGFAFVFFGIGSTAEVFVLTLFSATVLTITYSEYAQQFPSLAWVDLIRAYFPVLAFKQFPVNISIATVLGFMGGGGIGELLRLYMSLLDYRKVGAVILVCIIVIAGSDLLARSVWRKIQHRLKPVSVASENTYL